jgi:pimeloyl-ACP methyl ester carboxylesterase
VGTTALVVGLGAPKAGAQWLWPPQSMLDDVGSLNLQVVRNWTEWVGSQRIQLWEIRYNSWEFVNGQIRTIPIEAYYAKPASLNFGAAVVLAHGLGGRAEAGAAARFAAQHGVAAIYYSAPGCGQSGGRPFSLPLLFDTVPDPRGSWFWAHAVAGSRAITVLRTLQWTDPSRIGMSGYSSGAMATLNVNGFDNRLRCAIAISGTGSLMRAAENGGWINHLLHASGLWRGSRQFQILCNTVDPIRQAPSQRAPVMLINGAQDEFFPIDSTIETFNAFPNRNLHRLVIIPNWDHGLFTMNLPPPYETFDNSSFANARIDAATHFWIGHHLTNSSNFPNVPNIPTALMQEYFGQAALGGELATTYQVVEVHVYFSNDGSWLYGGQRMTHRTGNLWYKLNTGLPWSQFNPDTTVYFSEFRLRNSITSPEFWITSIPSVPPNFRPRIRPMPNPPGLQGDVNGDGCVNDIDIVIVLFNFGNAGGQGDANGDGRVDDGDVLVVLFMFGACR